MYINIQRCALVADVGQKRHKSATMKELPQLQISRLQSTVEHYTNVEVFDSQLQRPHFRSCTTMVKAYLRKGRIYDNDELHKDIHWKVMTIMKLHCK